jgi:hypothetical protein
LSGNLFIGVVPRWKAEELTSRHRRKVTIVENTSRNKNLSVWIPRAGGHLPLEGENMYTPELSAVMAFVSAYIAVALWEAIDGFLKGLKEKKRRTVKRVKKACSLFLRFLLLFIVFFVLFLFLLSYYFPFFFY